MKRKSELILLDSYPYILLNFMLSCVAAIQDPIILMSQNRSEADYEIYLIQKKLENQKQLLQYQGALVEIQANQKLFVEYLEYIQKENQSD